MRVHKVKMWGLNPQPPFLFSEPAGGVPFDDLMNFATLKIYKPFNSYSFVRSHPLLSPTK